MKLKYILLVVTIIFFSFSIQAQSKVGTVNIDFILSKLPELKQVQKDLDAYSAKLDSSLQQKVTLYKVALKDYQDNNTGFSELMKKTKQQRLLEIEDDVNKFRQNGIKLAQIQKSELLRPLYKKISDMIAVIAKEEQFTQILTAEGNEFAYADERFDITRKVLKKFGITVE